MPLHIIRNDISRVSADAIVNTANPQVAVGAGVDQAIYEAAGWPQLLAEREKIGPMQPGQAAATPAFALDAKYIIHTVGPVWRGGDFGEREAVASCYRQSLKLAGELECESIAFPLISTGTYGFPKDEALRIAIDEISSFLFTHDMTVYMVVYDREAFVISSKAFSDIQSYIEERDVKQRRKDKWRRRREEAYYGSTIRREEYPESSRREEPVEYSISLDKDLAEGSASEVLPGAGLSEDLEPENQNVVPGLEPKNQNVVPGLEPKNQNVVPGLEPAFMSEEEELELAIMSEAAEPEPVSLSEEELDYFEEFIPTEEEPPLPTAPKASMSYSSAYIPVEKKKRTGFFKKDTLNLGELLNRNTETFQQMLFRHIDRKGMKDPEVYKKANIDRKLFSKIRSNADYVPSKKTVLALAVALELNMDETIDLLQRAGLALSPSNRFDLIVGYCISHKIYNIFEINTYLFEYDEPLLVG